MQEKDLELLQILENNSRLSATEIATMTNLTPAEVESRIHALETAGVICKYTTVINWEKAGNGEVSSIIELKVSPERDFGYDRIAERLSRFRQVKTLRLMTGTYDLQLLLRGVRMRNFISDRAQNIPPSGIRKFFDLALTMEDVISLGVGEPDFRTPWNICESSIYSIEQGVTSDTPNKGLPILREPLSDSLQQHYNLPYNSDNEIIITSGVSEGLDIAIRAIVDPGDEVLIAQPSYVSYAPCVTLAGGLAVPVECTESDRFKLNSDALQDKITGKTKALI